MASKVNEKIYKSIFYLCRLVKNGLETTEKIIINFSDLEPGSYEYEFHVSDAFFQQFENTLIQRGNAEVKVNLVKHGHLLEAFVEFSSSLNLNCDRCLGEVMVPFEGSDHAVIRLGNTEESNSDANLIDLSSTAAEVDLSLFVYETICLELPLVLVPCELIDDESVCDNEMLTKLKELSIREEKNEKPGEGPGIWDKLKGFSPEED